MTKNALLENLAKKLGGTSPPIGAMPEGRMHFFLRRTSLSHHRNNSHLGKAPKILKQKIYIILADMFSLLQKLQAADEMLSSKDCLKYLGTSWVGASFIERTLDISHCCLCSEFCRATTLWVWGAPLLCAVQPSGLLSVD